MRKHLFPIIIVGILIMSGLVTATASRDNLIIKNHPPNKPYIIGEIEGKVGISYTYTFNAEDPDGDNVSYYIDWGDGTNYGWSGYIESGFDICISHTWNKIDRYPICCKAKDVYGVEGDWSDYQIEISKNKQIFNLPFLQFLMRMVQLQLLQRLLGRFIW